MKEIKLRYQHLIEVDEEERRIIIYRIFSSDLQQKQLYTIIDLPDKSFAEDERGYREFARIFGENILIDSPVARKIFDL